MVDGKPAFRLPLPDVTQVQGSQTDVMLELPLDDTAGGEHEDALMEMCFHVPRSAEGFTGEDDDDTSSATLFHEQVIQHTEAAAATGDMVASFPAVQVTNPRGRFDIELYLNFMKLTGMNQDYRIQFDSLHRLFLLPRPNTSSTVVAISLDPPIRKGNTFHPFIICTFSSDEERTLELDISDEALQAKNDAMGGKPMEKLIQGALPDVFAKALRGLATAKLTKPGTFHASDGVSCAVRCSFKADDGYLYPLEKAFFYVGKPPMLMVYEEQDSVEFLRQGGGILAASAKTFDFAVRSSDTEMLFRGIAKSEWKELFAFVEAKRMRIENVREAEKGPAVTPGSALDLDLGDDIDTGIARMQANADEEEEEDEDFEAGAAEQQEAEDEGDESGSDASGDAEMVDEDDAPRKKAPAADKPAKKPAKPREQKDKVPAAEGGAKPRAKRAKKDKNAPKAAMSAFMFFSNATRESVKAENPGLPITGVAKILGEKWKQLSIADREPYNEKAKADKVRAAQQKSEYLEQKKAAEAAGGADEAEIMSQ